MKKFISNNKKKILAGLAIGGMGGSAIGGAKLSESMLKNELREKHEKGTLNDKEKVLYKYFVLGEGK